MSPEATEPADAEIENLLQEVLAPVSDAHRAVAEAAFAWRDLDAELAELSEGQSAPALRSGLSSTAANPAAGRQLTYSITGGSITLDLEQTSATTVVAVVFVGVEPPVGACAITTPERNRRRVDVDDGTAVFTDLTVGSVVRVELERDGTVVAVTPWMTI